MRGKVRLERVRWERAGFDFCRASSARHRWPMRTAMAYIIERNNRFYVVTYDGIDPLTGRERRRWHPAGRSRADAEAIAATLDTQHTIEVAEETSPITLGRTSPSNGSRSARTNFARQHSDGTAGSLRTTSTRASAISNSGGCGLNISIGCTSNCSRPATSTVNRSHPRPSMTFMSFCARVSVTRNATTTSPRTSRSKPDRHDHKPKPAKDRKPGPPNNYGHISTARAPTASARHLRRCDHRNATRRGRRPPMGRLATSHPPGLDRAVTPSHRWSVDGSALQNENVATVVDLDKTTEKVLARLKRRQQRDGHPRAWEEAQLRTFLQAAAGHRLYAAFRLSAATGMRRSEVLGLKWSDMDWAKSKISVDRGLVSVGYERQVTRCKTEDSRRQIELDPTTLAMLSSWRDWQQTSTIWLGGTVPEWLFPADGGATHPHSFSQAFDRIVRNAGTAPRSDPTILTPACSSRTACLSRSSANDSATPNPRSRWTPTNTSCRACKPTPHDIRTARRHNGRSPGRSSDLPGLLWWRGQDLNL